MKNLPPLDAHAHLNPALPPRQLASSGVVLAMSLSLEGSTRALSRRDARIAWGVGCHPRNANAQGAFDVKEFARMAGRTAVIGEIGLDAGSRVPLGNQRRVFREVLKVIEEQPRIASIHSVQATELVLEELQRRPIKVAILHGWTGTLAETQMAVELGCYFSIHSQVARQSKFRIAVPMERMLVETDHGMGDPPAAIPCRVEWVEHLVAQQYGVDVREVRHQVWRSLQAMVSQTQTQELLPEKVLEILEIEGRG